MDRTISKNIRASHHGVHRRVSHTVDYPMVYTVENLGICHDVMEVPMVCWMLVACPMTSLFE